MSAPTSLFRPRFLHEGHVCALMLGLVAAASVAPALHFLGMDRGIDGRSTLGSERLLVVTAGVAAAWVGWFAVKEEALFAVLRSLWAGMLGAWAALGVVAGSWGFLENSGSMRLVGLAGGPLFGLVGLPTGLLFGLVAMIPIWTASMHRHNPSHEGPDDTAQATGAWASFLIAAAWALAPTPLARWGTAGALLISLSVAGVGTWRVRARRRFLQRVRDGKVPDWALEVISADEQVGCIPLVERLDLNAPLLGLVHHPSNDVGYRASSDAPRVVALVDGTGGFTAIRGTPPDPGSGLG